jgi:glycosyltransferase involved in cell wall biosynthesis
VSSQAEALLAPESDEAEQAAYAPVRVALLADMLEERWPSMDLVTASLVREFTAQTALCIQPQLVRPPLVRITTRWRGDAGVSTPDRVVNRFWLYRRALPRTDTADVFHVVDHSYSHLVNHLCASRTVVTCHDVDAFAEHVGLSRDSPGLPAFLVRRLVRGIQHAAKVVCPSRVTADALVASGLVSSNRVSVVANGVDIASMSPARANELTDRLLGHDDGHVDLLHVGSTIPRKRVDVLLQLFARVARLEPRARLIRVGGPFTASQAQLATTLGISDRVLVLPLVDRDVLAAVYHRCALLLATSEREGFGLPVAEALAAGTPVVATDLTVFREVAGDEATFVPLHDLEAWVERVMALLAERRDQPQRWRERRLAARSRGQQFSWARHARQMAVVYRDLAAGNGRA